MSIEWNIFHSIDYFRFEAEVSSLRREVASLLAENKQLLSSSKETTADAVQAIKGKLQDEVEQRQKALEKLQESERHVSVLQVDCKQLQQQWAKHQTDYKVQTDKVNQSDNNTFIIQIIKYIS